MYKAEELDKLIKEMATTIENVQKGKEFFPIVMPKLMDQVTKIQEILLGMMSNLTGEREELDAITKRSNSIIELSEKFDQLMDAREAELMSELFQKPAPVLPS